MLAERNREQTRPKETKEVKKRRDDTVKAGASGVGSRGIVPVTSSYDNGYDAIARLTDLKEAETPSEKWEYAPKSLGAYTLEETTTINETEEVTKGKDPPASVAFLTPIRSIVVKTKLHAADG